MMQDALVSALEAVGQRVRVCVCEREREQMRGVPASRGARGAGRGGSALVQGLRWQQQGLKRAQPSHNQSIIESHLHSSNPVRLRTHKLVLRRCECVCGERETKGKKERDTRAGQEG
jgi:hypothetical protein